jgi:HAMP domain-containing protein
MFSGTTVIFYKNMMTDKEIRSNLTNLRAFRDNLNNYLNGIDKSSVMLIYSPAIQDHLSENSNLLNSADRLKAYQDIYQKLKEISNNSYGISSVTIIDNYNNVFAIGDSSLTLPDASESSYGDLPWFRDAVRLNGVYRWDITDWSPSKKTIQMIRSIKSIRNQQTLGVVMFTIAPDILKSFFTSGNRAEGEYGIVVEDGAMYSNYPTDDQRAMIDAAVMKDEYGHYFASAGGRKYIVTYSSDPLTNWKFINMIEQSVLFKDITSIYWIWAIFFAATFLLIVLISWSIAKKISAPLKTLTTLNKKVEMGNLNVRFMSLYHDEVGVLGRSFNRMLDNIQEGLPLRREKILRSILEQNMSKDEFLALNRSTVLPLHNDFYQVCLLDFSPDLAPDRLERMERQLEQCEENAAMVWFTLKPGQICLIFNDNKEETNRIADKLVQDFHAWGIAATVYIGGDYPDIYFVKNSFEEAKDLIQYRFFSDSHCIRYEAIMARTWQMAYPDKYEKQLRFYIEQADLAQCRTLIDKLQAFTRDNHIKPVMIQMLLANIYIYLHQLAQKRNVDPQLLLIRESGMPIRCWIPMCRSNSISTN